MTEVNQGREVLHRDPSKLSLLDKVYLIEKKYEDLKRLALLNPGDPYEFEQGNNVGTLGKRGMDMPIATSFYPDVELPNNFKRRLILYSFTERGFVDAAVMVVWGSKGDVVIKAKTRKNPNWSRIVPIVNTALRGLLDL